MAISRMISLIRRSAACLCLIISSTFQLSTAQSYSWRTVETGGTGFVTGTVFHPTEPGLVYARTDVGGAYRLDSATNRWIALNDDVGGINNEFQFLGVLSIGLDPNDANRVYIATGQYSGTETWKLPSRIYRSTNRGATWTYVTPGFKMGGNEEGRGTGERMAVDPVNGANILLGTTNAGIWRSADYGATWARLSGFPSTLTGLNFLLYAPSVAPGPGPNRRVYAAANTLTGQSFWFSDDNGTTWAEVPNHPGKTPGAEMMPLQGSFDAAGVFYSTWGNATGPSNYSSNFGVWKLSADRNTWTSILPPTGQGSFGGISADPRVAGHVVVSTLLRWWPGDEVYRSTDGGTTWTAALRTGTRSTGNSPWSSGPGAHWITDVDIDPFNSNRSIFNNGFGLIQTTNLSTSGAARIWTFFSDGLEESVPLGLHSPTAGPPLVSVIADYTGFRHDDLSRSPLRGALSPGAGSTGVITGADLAPARMIRQNSGSTYYSQDAAATWAAFPTTPAPVINGQNRVILSCDGQRLLWCPPNSPAYVSANNGATWTISANTQLLTNTNNTQSVGVLAGAPGVPGTTNSSGGSARFNSPTAIALDSAGVRYVTDTTNHTIRRISAGGGVDTMAGGAGISGSADNATATNARFNLPAGLAVDTAKNVFVADTGNHTIRKITAAGVVTTLAGSAGSTGFTDATGTAARFNSPAGLAVDASGNVFVCDAGNHTIRKITSARVVTTVAGSPGVSGTTNANGTSARFNSPQGIVVDPSGNLYVTDSGNHAIRKITPAGDVTTFAGLAGTSGSTDATGGSARFNTPKAITLDASGTFHVADSGNHTVRKITSAGVVTTVAGLAGTSGTADGAGTTARFNSPSGIAATPDGLNVYVADTTNHTIRRNTLYNTLAPLADRVEGLRFYLWDGTAKRMLTSTDGGASFSSVATGMNSAFALFRSVPGQNGHLWVRAGTSGLYRSTNSGTTFTKLSSVTEVYQFDFGKAKPGTTHPAVFIWGKVGSTVGFFRSDDIGATWVRINDDLHNFGYQNDIAGDPRVYGRVYLATSGRGVVYGDFASPATPMPQPGQIVYDDAVQNGWTNASTGGTSLSSTNPVYRGSAAISVPAGSGKGVSLTCSSRSLQGIAALTFWIHGGTVAPPPLQIGISRGGIALEAVPVTVPATVGWQRVVLPLSQLNLATIDDLTGLRIENRTVNSVTPGAFSLDDIILGDPTTFTVTLSNLSATYDGTPKPVTVTTIPANTPVTVTYNGSVTVPTAVGSYAVSAVVSDPASTGSATGTLVIAKAAATVTLGSLNPTYNGSAKSATATTNPSGKAVDFTYNGSATAPTNAGSYAIVGTINDATYQGTASGTMVIAQASQTINFAALPGRVYGDVPFNLSAMATSALPVTFSIVSGPASLIGNTLTIDGAGNVVVRASQSGDSNRLAATDVNQSFVVAKAPASVTLANLVHTYDGSAKSATATTNPSGKAVDFTYNGSATAPTNAGSYEVTAVITDDHYEGSASGTLVVNPIPQTITFTPLPDKTFGDPAFALTATASSGLPVSFSIASGPAMLAGNTLTLTGAGAVTIRASQSGDETRAPAPDVNHTFNVAKATATVTLSGLSATYDGTPKPVSTATTPANLTVGVTYNGASLVPSSPGSYAVAATIVDDNHQGGASDTLVILDSRTPLENWRFEHFQSYEDEGNAANPADPDFDGIQNLMEFALGLDPMLPSALPATLTINGNQMEYTYTRSKAVLATVNFVVERTDSLSDGSWITDNVSEIAPPLSDDGVLQTIKVVLPKDGDRRFVRLRVIVQP